MSIFIVFPSHFLFFLKSLGMFFQGEHLIFSRFILFVYRKKLPLQRKRLPVGLSCTGVLLQASKRESGESPELSP